VAVVVVQSPNMPHARAGTSGAPVAGCALRKYFVKAIAANPVHFLDGFVHGIKRPILEDNPSRFCATARIDDANIGASENKERHGRSRQQLHGGVTVVDGCDSTNSVGTPCFTVGVTLATSSSAANPAGKPPLSQNSENLRHTSRAASSGNATPSISTLRRDRVAGIDPA
jgi:hypothetical protein